MNAKGRALAVRAHEVVRLKGCRLRVKGMRHCIWSGLEV